MENNKEQVKIELDSMDFTLYTLAFISRIENLNKLKNLMKSISGDMTEHMKKLSICANELIDKFNKALQNNPTEVCVEAKSNNYNYVMTSDFASQFVDAIKEASCNLNFYFNDLKNFKTTDEVDQLIDKFKTLWHGNE